MASRIGSLYAELGFRVDHRKLREFEKRLKDTHRRLEGSADRWRKDLERNTRAQMDGFRKVSKGLHKQRGELWETRNTFRELNNEYHRGNLALDDRQRLLGDLNRQYRAQKAHVMDLNKAHRQTPIGRLQQAREEYNRRRAGTVTGGAAGAGAGAGVAAGRATAIAQGTAIAGAVAFGLSEVFQMQQGMIKTLTALEGSREKGLARYQEIEKLANEEGQKLTDAIDAYKQTLASFGGTDFERMSLEISQNITKFREIRAYDREEFLRLQDILGDMASSESLNSEFVKRLTLLQISRGHMADMLGYENIEGFNKALDAGEIETGKFIRSFNRYMRAQTEAGGAMDRFRVSTQAEQNRLFNEALSSNTALNIAGLDKWMSSVYEGMREALGKAEIFFEEVGKGFGKLAEPAKESLVGFGELLGSVGRFSASLDSDNTEEDLLTFADILNGITAFIDKANTWLTEYKVADEQFKMLDKSLEDWWDDLVKTILDRLKEGILASIPFMSDPTVSHEERVRQSQESVRKIRDNAKRLDVSNLPSKHPRFRPEKDVGIKSNKSRVDVSGVNFLMKNLSDGLNRMPKVDPTNVDERFANYPPNHPLAASGRVESNVTQHNNLTVNIDGAQQPDAILGTIEDHINGLLRTAATNDPNHEK